MERVVKKKPQVLMPVVEIWEKPRPKPKKKVVKAPVGDVIQLTDGINTVSVQAYSFCLFFSDL